MLVKNINPTNITLTIFIISGDVWFGYYGQICFDTIYTFKHYTFTHKFRVENRIANS